MESSAFWLWELFLYPAVVSLFLYPSSYTSRLLRNKFVDPHAQHPPAHQLRLPMAINLRLRPVHDPRGPAELDGASSEICLTFRRLWPHIARTRSKSQTDLGGTTRRRQVDPPTSSNDLHGHQSGSQLCNCAAMHATLISFYCCSVFASHASGHGVGAAVQGGPPASISFPRRKVGTGYSTETFVLHGQLRSGRPRGE